MNATVSVDNVVWVEMSSPQVSANGSGSRFCTAKGFDEIGKLTENALERREWLGGLLPFSNGLCEVALYQFEKAI